MKTYVNFCFGLLLVGVMTSCQSTGPANGKVQAAFSQNYKRASHVSWTHNSDYSYAHFVHYGKPVVAVFGNDGQYITTEDGKEG